MLVAPISTVHRVIFDDETERGVKGTDENQDTKVDRVENFSNDVSLLQGFLNYPNGMYDEPEKETR